MPNSVTSWACSFYSAADFCKEHENPLSFSREELWKERVQLGRNKYSLGGNHPPPKTILPASENSTSGEITGTPRAWLDRYTSVLSFKMIFFLDYESKICPWGGGGRYKKRKLLPFLFPSPPVSEYFGMFPPIIFSVQGF